MADKNSLAGVLLGTALGDALGLVAEGMSPGAIARRFGRLEQFRLLPGVGVVSDDTEQAALIAQSLSRAPEDPALCVKAFRRAMAGWFLRLPWGLGMATLRACLRILLGFERSGVVSAGNGSTMRAPVVGVFFVRDPSHRHTFGEALARVTHLDPRAIEGSLFAAEVAAACASKPASSPRAPLIREALSVVRDPALHESILEGIALAEAEATPEEAAPALGNTGYIVPTLGVAAYAFVRGQGPLETISLAIAVGGDTDTIGAITGAWMGALVGEEGLPTELVSKLAPGPFGARHLRALAADLGRIQRGEPGPNEASYRPLVALARNLALFPVVLFHGVRVLLSRR